MKNKGKLVVIDGIDGSGKTTQIKLLSDYLREKNIDHEVISFPQYGKNEYAIKIEDYLAGKYGSIDEVNIKEIAKLYASDRNTVKDLIKSWLENGKLVIANRYASASKAHLGANIKDSEREEFFKWLDNLEYEENKIPKEDLTIILDVDPKIGQKNVLEKQREDIHEYNLEHLEKARQIYLDFSKTESNWEVVSCMDGGKMKEKEEIFLLVVDILKNKMYFNHNES